MRGRVSGGPPCRSPPHRTYDDRDEQLREAGGPRRQLPAHGAHRVPDARRRGERLRRRPVLRLRRPLPPGGGARPGRVAPDADPPVPQAPHVRSARPGATRLGRRRPVRHRLPRAAHGAAEAGWLGAARRVDPESRGTAPRQGQAPLGAVVHRRAPRWSGRVDPEDPSRAGRRRLRGRRRDDAPRRVARPSCSYACGLAPRAGAHTLGAPRRDPSGADDRARRDRANRATRPARAASGNHPRDTARPLARDVRRPRRGGSPHLIEHLDHRAPPSSGNRAHPAGRRQEDPTHVRGYGQRRRSRRRLRRRWRGSCVRAGKPSTTCTSGSSVRSRCATTPNATRSGTRCPR